MVAAYQAQQWWKELIREAEPSLTIGS